MASDWIKAKDSEFQIQADCLIATIAAYKDIWGLEPEDLTLVQQHKTDFAQALETQAAQAAAYHAVVVRKQTARGDLERALRGLVRRINNHPGMTDTLRQQMNLASPTRTQTRTLTTSRERNCDDTQQEKGTNHG